MPEDWGSVINDVEAALQDVGFDVVLRKPGSKSGSPSSPTFGSPSDSALRVIQRKREERNADGSLSGRVVTSFMFSALSPTVPVRGDKIIVPDGTEYVVDSVRKSMPGGVILYYRATSVT